MSENESAPAESTPVADGVEQVVTEEKIAEPVAVAAEPEASAPAIPPEEITYHAVEKDGQVSAIWEMQGRKHVRTIDPRSRQGQDILRLYTADHHEETPAAEASDAAVV